MIDILYLFLHNTDENSPLFGLGYLSSTELQTRGICWELVQSLSLKRLLLLLLDDRISKNSLRNYGQDFIGSVLLDAFVNNAGGGVSLYGVVTTDAFAAFELTLKNVF